MTCPDCDGAGWIVTCIDDMCRGSGECIHGDGEDMCRMCYGSGEIGGEDDAEFDDDLTQPEAG